MFDRLRNLFEGIEKKDGVKNGPPEYIVAGLGNPGREYEGTRHNAGFMALDRLAKKLSVPVTRIKFKSLCGDATIAGRRVLLLKPQTFMNLSGEAVRDAAEFYKVPLTHVIVLHDDVSLSEGKLRVRQKGSAGGHNGLKNLIYLTGTDVFPRVKIGVGEKPRPNYDLVKWVLGRFPAEQWPLMEEAFDNAGLAVEEIIQNGVASAMNRFNGNEK
jgi:PTH1 family peptidyl-tRNA hydrolase